MTEIRLRRQIRNWIIFFIVAITLSGITAFPLETELQFLAENITGEGRMAKWVQLVYAGIHDANQHYPFLSYGTDWLAFAHLIIAMLFIGPLKDPVRNAWIINWAIVCCILVFPLALIAGPIRQVPFFHQMIDCSFGIFGLIPLFLVRNKIHLLEQLQTANP